MGCFLVPMTEAIAVTAVKKIMEHKEKKNGGDLKTEETGHIAFSQKLQWLSNMLWGGSALLAFEHLWHGEIVPWPPFLTAASNPADWSALLTEMGTVGVTMALLVTTAWVGIGVAACAKTKEKAPNLEPEHSQGAAQ
ncbi:MAG: hypothetical protein K6G50_05550 [bacterium]|nr:hypothetical protein [bacterium]